MKTYTVVLEVDVEADDKEHAERLAKDIVVWLGDSRNTLVKHNVDVVPRYEDIIAKQRAAWDEYVAASAAQGDEALDEIELERARRELAGDGGDNI